VLATAVPPPVPEPPDPAAVEPPTSVKLPLPLSPLQADSRSAAKLAR
jgi:hypothetical protein